MRANLWFALARTIYCPKSFVPVIYPPKGPRYILYILCLKDIYPYKTSEQVKDPYSSDLSAYILSWNIIQRTSNINNILYISSSQACPRPTYITGFCFHQVNPYIHISQFVSSINTTWYLVSCSSCLLVVLSATNIPCHPIQTFSRVLLNILYLINSLLLLSY